MSLLLCFWLLDLNRRWWGRVSEKLWRSFRGQGSEGSRVGEHTGNDTKVCWKAAGIRARLSEEMRSRAIGCGCRRAREEASHSINNNNSFSYKTRFSRTRYLTSNLVASDLNFLEIKDREHERFYPAYQRAVHYPDLISAQKGLVKQKDLHSQGRQPDNLASKIQVAHSCNRGQEQAAREHQLVTALRDKRCQPSGREVHCRNQYVHL